MLREKWVKVELSDIQPGDYCIKDSDGSFRKRIFEKEPVSVVEPSDGNDPYKYLHPAEASQRSLL